MEPIPRYQSPFTTQEKINTGLQAVVITTVAISTIAALGTLLISLSPSIAFSLAAIGLSAPVLLIAASIVLAVALLFAVLHLRSSSNLLNTMENRLRQDFNSGEIKDDEIKRLDRDLKDEKERKVAEAPKVDLEEFEQTRALLKTKTDEIRRLQGELETAKSQVKAPAASLHTESSAKEIEDLRQFVKEKNKAIEALEIHQAVLNKTLKQDIRDLELKDEYIAKLREDARAQNLHLINELEANKKKFEDDKEALNKRLEAEIHKRKAVEAELKIHKDTEAKPPV
jgi:hypothetical protein